jgi:hypothetical protein
MLQKMPLGFLQVYFENYPIIKLPPIKFLDSFILSCGAIIHSKMCPPCIKADRVGIILPDGFM